MLISTILTSIRRAFAARQLRKARIPELRWRNTVSQVRLLRNLNHAEQHRLRELTSRFLHKKSFSSAGGLALDDAMRILIATQACLLVLELDLDYFDGWHEIIVYPDTFIVRRETFDTAGLVHENTQALGGEAWDRGPVILSWADARPGVYPHGEGSNVILHEFAHKLDMLNGTANGMPPLHKNMQLDTWTQVFQEAYNDLSRVLASGHPSMIDPYAAQSPVEFFAVTTEAFFENPHRLQRAYPAVYTQLRLFFRQDPLQRYPNDF